MKTKKTKKENAFLRLLAQYSALGGALIGSANQAQATIQYATLSGTPVSNASDIVSPPGGGMLRFIERFEIVTVNSVYLSIGGGVSVSGTASVYFPNARDAGFLVGAGGAWNSEATQLLGYYDNNSHFGGNFLNSTNRFLAFRFDNGGIKYGWLRLSVNSDASSFTLVDWAYQDDGSSILTGDMGSLPIELLSFDAKAFQHAVALEWATAREESFDGFSLERATEGGSFSEIAWLPGHGNSDTPRSYRYRDEAIDKNKRYYYRLKSIDLNGSFEYSHVVEAAFSDFGFTLSDPYPNPVTGKKFDLEIQAQEAETVHIRLFSSTGQMVHDQAQSLTSGLNKLPVSVPHLAAGTYFLKVEGRYYSSYKQVMVQ